MRLAHLHIPHLIPYTQSLRLQNVLVERHFAYKDWLRSSAGRSGGDVATRFEFEKSRSKDNHKGNTGLQSSTQPRNTDTAAAIATDTAAERGHQEEDTTKGDRSPATDRNSITSAADALTHLLGRSPPDPTLLTFCTFPTYTVGRRHLLANPISPEQQAFLTADGRATFHASPRGGLLTYHAPGQLTGYIIADLRRHGISPRCWVKLLEESVMRTCAAWDVPTMRTDDPGVWIKDDKRQSSPSQIDDTPTGTGSRSDRKICALGVQVSRGITSHGIGLNVFDAPLPQISGHGYDFTPEQTASGSYDPLTKGSLSWGFSRIVACGLEGKSVTWLTRERGRRAPILQASGVSAESGSEAPSHDYRRHDKDRTVQSEPGVQTQIPLESVADVFAQQLRHSLNTMRGDGKESVDGIYRIQDADILPNLRDETLT